MEKNYKRIIMYVGGSIAILTFIIWTFYNYSNQIEEDKSYELTQTFLSSNFDKEIKKAYPFLVRCQAELTIYASCIDHAAIHARKLGVGEHKYKDLFKLIIFEYQESPVGKSGQYYIEELKRFSNSRCYEYLKNGGEYRAETTIQIVNLINALSLFNSLEEKSYEQVRADMRKIQKACLKCMEVLQDIESDEVDLDAWAYYEKMIDEMNQKRH